MSSLQIMVKGESAYAKTLVETLVNVTDNTFSIPNHGLADGDQVMVTTSNTVPVGLVAAKVYYVVSATANTFKVALTSGGSAIDITGDGTGTHTVTKVKTRFDQLLETGNLDPRKAASLVANYFDALASGTKNAAFYINSSAADPVAASATATLVSCATDTITIGGITFTGTGTPTTELHFETDGDDAADAAALAAAINAHSTLSKVVSATSADNVVTITCKVKGEIGNFLAITESGSTITVTAFSGGTGGGTQTAVSYSCGVAV
jgi:hypothetical protein